MSRFTSLLLLVAGVAAQPAINQTVLGEIANALNGAGLTDLAAAAGTISNTPAGGSVLGALTNGDANYTIFAPTNKALGSANQTLLKDPNQLANIISYHVVAGNYGNATEFFTQPNNTIIRTFLNSTDYVHLGNASQVISANVRDGDIYINNQNGNLKVNKIDTVSRFTILQIDRVLLPPASLASVAKANNLTLFAQAAQQANVLDAVTGANGITIFAPTDEALTAALASLGDNAKNVSLIQTILQNHIINGTAVYSSEFHTNNLTSAAGQALGFNVQGDTIKVSSGTGNNITANVTRRDVLTSNGVIHIIDAVLANTARDDGAASSAYSSATSAAGAATPTGGNGDNGGNNAPVGGGPQGGSNGGSGAGFLRAEIAWTAVLGAGFMSLLAATAL